MNRLSWGTFSGWIRSQDAFHAGVVVLVILLNLAFGLPRLKPYSAVDEPYWTFDRTPQYWEAIRSGRWRSTNINDKPGVTVAALSGVGLLTIDPLPYKDLRDERKSPEQLAAMDTINVAFRLPIYLFAVLSLPFFYLLTRKAIGRSVALVSTIGIGLSPLILGISLIINPDSLLWIFLPLAVLARLAFGKTHEWKYLIAAGILTGLSLLTKYVANILFVFFFILPFLEYVFAEKKPDIVPFLRRSLRDLTIIIATSIVTFAALFPATWVKPEMILKGTILSAAFESTWPLFAGAIILLAADAFFIKGKFLGSILGLISRWRHAFSSALLGLFLSIIAFVVANTWLGMRWFDFEAFVMSPKNSASSATLLKSVGSVLADFYSLIFGIHPIILIGLVGAIIIALIRKTKRPSDELVLVSFTFLILLYYVGSTANYVIATIRYQIALYPLAFIMASIGLVALCEWIGLGRSISAGRRALAIIALIAALSSSLLAVQPHFFTYASSLLPQSYLLNYKDMGDGSYEAAQFLNALPDAESLRVWSDKGAVCAAFVGDCSVSFKLNRLKESIPDYVALSTGRKRKTVSIWSSESVPLRFQDAYETAPAEFSLILDGRPNNFVKVIDVKKSWREEE